MTMSPLKNLRIGHRFNKSERDDRNKDSKDGSKSGRPSMYSEELYDMIEFPEEERCRYGQAVSEDGQSCSSFTAEDMVSSIKWQSCDEKQVFEEQLNQLQEQLMIIMIENQTLKSELNSSKRRTELEKVKIELEYERRRCEILEKNLHQVSKKTVSVGRDSSVSSTTGAFINVDDGNGPSLETRIPEKRRWCLRLRESLLNHAYTFLGDFTDEPEPATIGDPDGDPLTIKTFFQLHMPSVKYEYCENNCTKLGITFRTSSYVDCYQKLKENIKRFGTEAKPYVNTIMGMYGLMAWKSAPYTLIVFGVYMHSVWQGWFLPVLLFCLTFRLFINFLRYRGWNISFNFFETLEETKDSEEKDLGVSDKFNLVMQVARKVQNVLGKVADSLEKIKSLVTWRHPEASQRLFLTVSVAFITSCIVPTSALFFIVGLGLGIKFFIVDFIFNRFPRVRKNYDSTWRLWNELPTDIQYERRNAGLQTDKDTRDFNADDTQNQQVSMDDRTFCELFALPESEFALPGWHGGRRCTLINKDKSFPAAFKNGRLYLTHSFLCFERNKMPSQKNIVIPLADILRLEKVKPYGWMPGGGMAFEVTVAGNDKPYIFGAIINRDEMFNAIQRAGHKAGLSWSTSSSLTG